MEYQSAAGATTTNSYINVDNTANASGIEYMFACVHVFMAELKSGERMAWCYVCIKLMSFIII